MFGLGVPELMLIVFVVLLIFGPKKLPALAKSMGQGITEFKEGMKDLKNDSKEEIEGKKE